MQQKEAQKKMDDLKNQFALSHPEYAFGGSNEVSIQMVINIMFKLMALKN